MPEFPAITHVALTVTSLERSVLWYKGLFGSDPILDEDTGPFQRVAWLIGGTIVRNSVPRLGQTEPFNERRPGLDHLAFGCGNRGELKAWEIVLTNSVSRTVASYTRLPTRHCRFEIPTTSPLSSSQPGAKPRCTDE